MMVRLTSGAVLVILLSMSLVLCCGCSKDTEPTTVAPPQSPAVATQPPAVATQPPATATQPPKAAPTGSAGQFSEWGVTLTPPSTPRENDPDVPVIPAVPLYVTVLTKLVAVLLFASCAVSVIPVIAVPAVAGELIPVIAK